MKNVTMFLLVTAVFGSVLFGLSTVAHADVLCANGTMASTTCASYGNGNPDNVSSAWGTNGDVPHITGGQTVYDAGGVPSTCPTYISDCVDITHTSYYAVMMTQLGAQLKALGVTGGMFGYWISMAK